MRWWMFAILIVAMAMALAACDVFSKKREAQRDLMVRAQMAVAAQQMFFEHAAGGQPRFAKRLENLVAFKPALISDSTVTFKFERTAFNYYDITLTRAGQDWSIRCRADVDCELVEHTK
ncbi:MAG: hypothetical protein P9L99_17780 [Candidatus Lernaella stagnicola]|nr:hypothetical protein [Candidatus Lernaella stagnicola]